MCFLDMHTKPPPPIKSVSFDVTKSPPSGPVVKPVLSPTQMLSHYEHSLNDASVRLNLLSRELQSVTSCRDSLLRSVQEHQVVIGNQQTLIANYHKQSLAWLAEKASLLSAIDSLRSKLEPMPFESHESPQLLLTMGKESDNIQVSSNATLPLQDLTPVLNHSG